MKLNNKGFAVSSILYSLMILFVFLIFTVIMLFANSKVMFDKMKTDMKADLEGVDKVTIVPNSEYQLANFQEDKNIIENFFAYNVIGKSPISSIKCIDKTYNSTEVSNVNELSIGSHEIECTITKTNNYSKSATTSIAVSSDYVCSSVIVGTTGNIAYGTYKIGDEYECNPGDGKGRRFFVISSTSSTVKLIMDRNLGNNVSWNGTGGSTINEASAQLQSMTSSWKDVTVGLPVKNDIYGITNSLSINKDTYPYLLTNINCNNNKCSENATQGINNGYWTATYEGSGAYAVNEEALETISTTSTEYGVRPVITVNKSDIYDSFSGLTDISIIVSPAGWSDSKTVTITYPANMNNLEYEYSTDGSTWTKVADRQQVLTFTTEGYVIARMVSGSNYLKSKTMNVTQIDTYAPEIKVIKNDTTGFVNVNSPIFGDYLTVINKGSSGIASQVCYDLSNGSAVVSNVKDLAAGNHSLRCVVTKQNGLTATANLTISVFDSVTTFSYKDSFYTYKVPETGYYKFEAWGASGGGATGGKGGYSSGYVYLTKGTEIYVYVGYNPTFTTGSCYETNDNDAFNANYMGSCAGGGGATDFRLVSGEWNDTASLVSRILVAGGGGGQLYAGYGGAGGGLIAQSGYGIGPDSTYYVGTGGTQTGVALGLSGRITTTGGGGYYGGAGGLGGNAGGGSSFISGYSGCNAVDSSGNPTGSANHYSGKVFVNSQMLTGNDMIPNHNHSGFMTGNSGNGYATITFTGNENYVKGEALAYDYNGSYYTFTAPKAGYYLLEGWGAQGGAANYNGTIYDGGKGAYTSQYYYLNANQKVYVYVGGMGQTSYVNSSSYSFTANGYGYNGGAAASASVNNSAHSGGGGATHFALTTGLLKTFSPTSTNLLSVAGGGGGSAAHIYAPDWSGYGGAGGATNGLKADNRSGNYYCYAYGGTLTSGGFSANTAHRNTCHEKIGSFGQGGGNESNIGESATSGGGGGYYGGGSGVHGAGGGGSSYVNLVIPGSYQKQVLSGAESMKVISGSTATGNSGNGKAVITYAGDSIIKVNDQYVFNYSGNYQKFKAPVSGYYKFEAWGARGGNAFSGDGTTVVCANGAPSYGNGCGGNGAYTNGTIYLHKDQVIYVYAGGAGNHGVASTIVSGGFNGGGAGEYDHTDNEASGGGGGATDFRVATPTQKYRYVRDYLGGSSANNYNHWVEIQVYDIYGNLVSHRKTVTPQVTPITGAGTQSVITDGAYGDPAAYCDLGESGKYYVEIDLGDEYEIGYVKVWHYYGDSRTYNNTKTILYSADRQVANIIYDSAVDGTYSETSWGRTTYVKNTSSLATRIMVAAGGGGASDVIAGNYGGTLTSGGGQFSYGASQTSGFLLGLGQNAKYKVSNIDVAGGGGGWYGGFSEAAYSSNDGTYGQTGSGGSSYISGFSGSNAANLDGTPVGTSTNFMGLSFTSAQMIAGNGSMPNKSGSGTMTGNADAGFAKITLVSTAEIKSGQKFIYDYTGDVQVFVAPKTGTYKLETWGAQGGGSITNGTSVANATGFGGYSTGTVSLTAGQKLYIYVGGAGADAVEGFNSRGGYNGGGYGTWDTADDESSGAGGGATHIATASGLLSSLSGSKDSILIVAGGGGGQSWTMSAGSGGGETGGMTSGTSSNTVNQTTGYAFGQGQNASGTAGNDGVGGGGGGYYGGYMNNVASTSSGQGGSGYLKSTLGNKAMFCYNCTAGTYTTVTTCNSLNPKSTCNKKGNGYAQITYIEPVEGEFDYTGTVQTFVAPKTGTYKLETWGASGGAANGYIGGYGGYSVGTVSLTAGQTLYVYVGGDGTSSQARLAGYGGYNGGGTSSYSSGFYDLNYSGGGGGATHIATSSGLLSALSSNTSSILIVAGGGGGGVYQDYIYPSSENHGRFRGGHAGGYLGSGGTGASCYNGFVCDVVPLGGSQSAGGAGVDAWNSTTTSSNYKGSFGLGANGPSGVGAGGGGGGYYGGGSGGYNPGGGGSGYISNSSLSSKYMYCYGCKESTTASTYTINTIGTSSLRDTTKCSSGYSASPISKCAKIGNGYAKISYVG